MANRLRGEFAEQKTCVERHLSAEIGCAEVRHACEEALLHERSCAEHACGLGNTVEQRRARERASSSSTTAICSVRVSSHAKGGRS